MNDVQPGKYVLMLSAEVQTAKLERVQFAPVFFEVPELKDGDIGKRLDLGVLKMQNELRE